jgi:uncharacterized protein with PQ loop repeat
VHQVVSIQSLLGAQLDLHAIAVAGGYLGSARGVGMVVPQILRTLRNRQLRGVSALSWSMTALSCFTWLLYGVRADEVPQIPGNVLMVSGAISIVLLVPSIVPSRLRAARLAGLLLAIAIIALWAPPTAIGLLAFGIGVISSWPQLLTSLRRPVGTPSSLSISAWWMRCLSQASWLFYAVVLHDVAVTISAVFLITTAALVLGIEHRRGDAVAPELAPLEAMASA